MNKSLDTYVLTYYLEHGLIFCIIMCIVTNPGKELGWQTFFAARLELLRHFFVLQIKL